MEKIKILEELLLVLESAGIKTRMELMEDSNGGLCKIDGKKILFLNSSSSPEDLAVTVAKVLKTEVDLETVFIKPAIRSFIENNPV